MPRLAYNIPERKVGCVLLQAAMGGDAEIAKQIPTEDWQLMPSDDLVVYNITDAQVEQLINMHRRGRRASTNS